MKKSIRFALLSASLLVAVAPAINANIPAMAEHFNHIPLSLVEMLSTLPSLFLMIAVLLSSFIAKKCGYKNTIMMGLGLVMFSGVIPIVIDDFYMILISRGALGFGVGLFNSLLVSMVNTFCEGNERSSMYGLQSAFEGAGGIFITFVAGQLLKINWQAPFFAYLIAIPVFLIFYKFVPKVETSQVLLKNGTSNQKQEAIKGSFLPIMGYMLILFIAAMLYMTMGIKVASLMTTQGYGTASDASLVLISLSLGGILSGLFFGKILNLLKSYTTSMGLFILSIAMFILSISQSIVLTFFAGFITGIGFKLFMPSLIDKVNRSNISNKSLATSLLLVSFNLGAFISPYGSILLQKLSNGTSLNALFSVCTIGFILLAMIMLVTSFLTKNKTTA